MKLKMVVVTLLIGSSFTFANPALFKVRKESILNHIDKKIELLNEFKSCVSEANKHSDLKACRQNHRASMAKLREEFRAKRAEIKSNKAQDKEE